MKLGQLIKFNTKNIFLEKSYTKCERETSPRPFPKIQNSTFLWINRLKFYTVCFFVYPSQGLLKYIETKVLTTCF